MMKPKTMVKVYNWKGLARLAVDDMCKNYGVSRSDVNQLHYIAGLDEHMNIFLRIDLSPLKDSTKKKR